MQYDYEQIKNELGSDSLYFSFTTTCSRSERLHQIRTAPHHKTLTEQAIPVEAFFGDSDKELTIEFAQDWKPVTIEIKSKEGYIVYRNLYMSYSNSILSIPLENIPAGVYELTISSGNTKLIGEFINEN